jgi:5-methylcytosine-specific restriction endonuclease McrA
VDSWQKTCRPPATGNKQLAKICLMCNRGFKPEKRRIKYCSDNCRMQALHEVQTKEDHPSWRGGTVKGRRRLEITNEYKNWRLSVFKRDKYLCVLCGSNKDICVHHIKPLSLYPELGMALHNGATLCKTCHLKTYYKEERFEPLINKILLLLREVYSENMSPFIFIENSYASS